MSFAIAALLRPFAAFILFAFILLPLKIVLRKYWPAGKSKDLLFDETFRKRRPVAFGALVVVSVFGTIFFMDWLFS